MDQQVIQDLYNRAVSKGYKKSQDEFVQLLYTDGDVFNDMFSYVQSKGYGKSSSDFEVLIGKKKDEAVPPAEETVPQQQQPAAMASPSGVSSSASPSAPQEFKGFSPEQLKGLQASAQEAPEVARIKAEPAMAKAREEERAKTMAEVKTWEGYKEQPYFQGELGNAIRAIPFGIGDFVDDIGRAVGAGSTQADLTMPSSSLMVSGASSSPEQIKKFVQASKALEGYGPSDEMVAFTKSVEEDNGGIWGFVKGLAQNPTVLPEVMISSFRAMVNPASATAAGTVVGGAAAGGAAVGGVGAAPAALASIPYAMGTAGATLETGLSFAEFMNEELQKRGLELNEENVKTILEDEDALSKIRTRAASRGVTIGVIDAFTGRVAGRVGAKMALKPGAATIAGKIKGGLAGAGIEAVGGSAGEATARAIAGQEMDIAEIGLEGIGEAPMAVIDIAAEVMRSPRYKVNGEVRTKEDIQELIRTSTPEQLQSINFDIKNDRDNLSKQIQDKVETGQLTNEIRQVNPNLSDDAVGALVSLERELRSLENNKTQAAKNKSAEIRSTIKDIQDTGVVPAELVPAPATPTIPEGERLTPITTEGPAAEAKPLTRTEITNPDLKTVIDEEVMFYEDMLKRDEEFYNEQMAEWNKKGLFQKMFGTLAGTKPSYKEAVRHAKRKLEQLENNPEAHFQQTLDFYMQDAPEGISAEQPEAIGEETENNRRYRTNLVNILKTFKGEKNAIQEAKPAEIPQEIASLADDENVVMTVKTLEEVPEEFRDRAEKVEGADVEVRKTILGFPIGKKTTRRMGDGFRYTLTGKEVKDYAIQKQAAGQVPVQPTPGGRQEVAQREPQAGPQEIAQAGQAQEGVVSSRTLEEQVSALEQMMTEDETNDLIDEFALAVDTVDDAQAALSRGDLVYVFDETTETPTLVSDATVLSGYTPDRIAVVPRENSPMAQQPQAQPQMSAVDFIRGGISPTENVVIGSNKAQLDSVRAQTTDATKRRVLEMVDSGMKVLKALFPNVDIAVHTTAESYNQAMRNLGYGTDSKGRFSYVSNADGKVTGGRIDIDLSSADGLTVAHEIAHAVMLKAFGDNPTLFKGFRNRISKILADSTLKQLNDFADQYSESESHEEFLVQLAGLLTDNAQELSRVEPTTIQKIADAINSIVSTITGGRFVPFEGTIRINQLVDFFNTMTRSIREGEPIDLESITMGDIVYDGVVNPNQLRQKAYKKYDVKWDVPAEAGFKMAAPKDKMSLYEAVDKSGGAVVITNSDATGVGVTKDGEKLQGGIGYTFIEENVKDDIGFAASEDGKISAIFKAAQDSADKRDAENPEMKGKPVAVFVMMQSGPAMFGNAYGATYFGKVLKRLTGTTKITTKEAKKELLDFIDDYVKVNKKGRDYKASFEKLKSLIRNTDFTKPDSIQKIVDLLTTDRTNLEKKKGVEKFGFDVRRSFFEKFFIGTGKVNPTTTKTIDGKKVKVDNPAVKLRNLLKEMGFGHEAFIYDYGDKNFLDLLEGKTPSAKLNDGNFVLTGFYIDPYQSKDDYKAKSKSGTFKHKQFNSKFHGVDPFVLDGKVYVNDVFPEARFYSESGAPIPVSVSAAGSLYPRTRVGFADVVERAKKESAASKAIEQYEKADAKDKPKLKSKAQVAVHKDTGFVPVGFWVEQLKGKTAYLDEIIKHVLKAREELKEGKVRERKVVKAYLITIGSVLARGGTYSEWKKKTNQEVSDVFLEKVNGKDHLRPEGVSAAYLITPDGEKLVDDIINGTATFEQIRKMFEYVGFGLENKRTNYVLETMKNDGFKAMTDLFNKNKGSDFNELYKGAIKNFAGISEGKTGFFNQFFGVTSRGVIDARELNAWVAGSMDLTPEQRAKVEKVSRSKKLGEQLLGYIEQVGIELGYPKDLAGYIAHHAIWDAIENSITRHEGEYMVVSKAQVKEEGAEKEKYKVVIVFKSKFGGSRAKPYEFNDKRHFDNWFKKYGEKYDIRDIYEMNSKAQLSKLRGMERIVELGRASGFSDEAITVVLQKKGYSQSEIDNALKTKKAASKVVIEETFVEGYDRMMGEVDGIIEKGLRRGSTQEQILENVINYIQGSKAYENATDVQREQLIRDARAAFGKKEKSAPKVERILGTLKDVKNITMSEYQLLKKQIKDYAKGAKDATKAWRLASDSLTKDLRELVRGGKITSKQAVAVLRRFSKVNMFDPNSIESFVNYMTKVFENAEYAERISGLRKKLKTARDSASRKIGIAEGLYPMLNRMLRIDPTLVPDAVLDTYAEIVEMLSKRDAVLKLQDIRDVTEKVKSVLSAIDDELSKLDALSEIFEQYQDKVVDENGKIQFADTLDAMVSDGTITNDEAKILRKYKNTVMPRVEKAKKTEQELQDEKDEMLRALASVDIDADMLPTQDERDLARELQQLKNTDAAKELSNGELEKLLRVIDNINNGYLPHYAQLMKERLNSINNEQKLESSVKKAKPLPVTQLYARLKKLFFKNSKALELMVQRNPLFYIDQVFGDFKTKDIFNSVLKGISDAMGVFNLSIQRVEDKLNGALDAVARSHKNDPAETKMSSYKMMAYMLQLEFQSNPDSVGVHPAADFLKATIKHIREGNTTMSDVDADMLQEILTKYSTDGNIDAEKLFNSFNTAEKGALETIKGINTDMRDKAVFTAHIIRGDKLTPLNNYVHHNVLHDFKPEENISGVTSAEEFNNMMQPSTRGKSLISRTKGVKPLDFNVFSATQRGANYVLMDYYLTEPIRTARKTLNATKEALEKDGMSKNDREVFNAISKAFETAVRNTLMTRFHNNTFADEVVNFVTKNGYRAVLASTTRWVAELTSNMGFIMIADPKSWMNGVKNYMDVVSSPNSIDILTNLKSSQSARLYPSDTLSGRMIDSSTMNQASGIRGGKTNGVIANAMQRIYNNSLKKYQNFVETTADSLISTPDKIMMRPYWFGSFAAEFKKLTGKEPNFDLIAEKDEAYMNEFKDELKQSTQVADEKSVLAGASDNPFMGILKGQVTPDMPTMLKAFNIFNNYMTRFLIYEYSTARTGIMAAMGNGKITRKQGAALLGGAATRMVVYTLLTSTLSNALVGLFVDDEDEDDEKSLLQKMGQAIASGMTSLLLGRDFGNATRTIINYGVERANEEFLTGLRNGNYDPYKDAIAYSAFAGQSDNSTLGDYAINMMGPITPIAKTTALIFKKASEEPKKEQAARERAEKEVNVRIPLEVLGNVGLVPLYKDVRKVVLADIYKGMKKELGKVEGKAPEFQLPFEMNKEDMERYYPEMYKQMYGKGSLDYELKQMEKALKSQSEEIERKMKDEMYNYTPKKKERKKRED